MLDSSQSIVAATATKNNILVRTKAAWSLANFCDILSTVSDLLPNETYKQLFQSSTNACLDTDKVTLTTNRYLYDACGMLCRSSATVFELWATCFPLWDLIN